MLKYRFRFHQINQTFPIILFMHFFRLSGWDSHRPLQYLSAPFHSGPSFFFKTSLFLKITLAHCLTTMIFRFFINLCRSFYGLFFFFTLVSDTRWQPKLSWLIEFFHRTEVCEHFSFCFFFFLLFRPDPNVYRRITFTLVHGNCGSNYYMETNRKKYRKLLTRWNLNAVSSLTIKY